MSKDISTLTQDFQDALEEHHLSFEEEECLFALKNYIDGRLDLLQEKLDQIVSKNHSST